MDAKDKNGNPTGKFEVSEELFKKELNKIRDLASKAIEKAGTTGQPELTPEQQTDLEYLKSNGWTEEEARAELGFNQPLSTGVNGSPVVSKIVNNYEQGQKGGQCGRFVNNILGTQVGDSYASKLAYTDPAIGTQNNPPKPGDLFVVPYKQTGHTGIVMDITPKNDGTYDVKVADSNYNLNEKVSFHTLNSKNMSFGRV